MPLAMLKAIEQDAAQVHGLSARLASELRDVLAAPGRCGLTPSQLAMITAFTTHVVLLMELRRDLYRTAGYVRAGRLAPRPTEPVELFRGAPTSGGAARAGLSWTRKAAVAGMYAGHGRRSASPAGCSARWRRRRHCWGPWGIYISRLPRF